MSSQPKPTGRPSEYSPEIAEAICLRLAEGESLRKICTDPEMPGRRTVHDWLMKHKEFAAQYDQARDMQAEGFVDEIVEIADNNKDSQSARVQIDARKWIAGKMKPKKYGDKTELAVSGPVTLVIEGSDKDG
jgi:terminase small subunit-like protein